MYSDYLIIAAAAVFGLTIVCAALLKGWHGWLALKRRELDQQSDHHRPEIDSGAATGMSARIEIADLKERIRKLEAIAAGVDL
jgi:hypothetical protein